MSSGHVITQISCRTLASFACTRLYEGRHQHISAPMTTQTCHEIAIRLYNMLHLTHKTHYQESGLCFATCSYYSSSSYKQEDELTVERLCTCLHRILQDCNCLQLLSWSRNLAHNVDIQHPKRTVNIQHPKRNRFSSDLLKPIDPAGVNSSDTAVLWKRSCCTCYFCLRLAECAWL